MEHQYEIIRQLAAGESLHPGAEVTATAESFGLELVKDANGIKLAQPLELLDPEKLGTLVSESAKQKLSSLDLHWSLGSTNTFVLDLSKDDGFHGYVCLAEQQTSGKGRRGRHWVSPFGKNVYMSVGWRLPVRSSLDGLSLAVGCACARAINSITSELDLRLKWPNDLLIGDGKAGGILTELGHGESDAYHVVIGTGINLQLSERDSAGIDQPWSVVRGISRNELVAALVSELVDVLEAFGESGFSAFRDEWNDMDGFAGQEVNILSPAGDRLGIAKGVDESGNLQLEVDGKIELINSGEVSLRRAAGAV